MVVSTYTALSLTHSHIRRHTPPAHTATPHTVHALPHIASKLAVVVSLSPSLDEYSFALALAPPPGGG